MIEIELEEQEGVENYFALNVVIQGARGKIAPRDSLIFNLLKKAFEITDGDWTKPFVEINMPCGQKITYEKSSDIPWESVPCPCGNPKHWVIKYEERFFSDADKVKQ